MKGNEYLGETREEDNIPVGAGIVQEYDQLLQEEFESIFDEMFGIGSRSGVLFVTDGRVEFTLLAGSHLGLQDVHHVFGETFASASVRRRPSAAAAAEPAAEPALLGRCFVLDPFLIANTLNLIIIFKNFKKIFYKKNFQFKKKLKIVKKNFN